MTSKIQQAKNEKQLKELARLTENKRCAICTCMVEHALTVEHRVTGTQYTCQPPSIFVCSTCAGAMYHFPGFRVKSRSMATYTAPEVQQMKEGGNAVFHRQYLAKWNPSSFPAPTDKNPKKVEEFIKQVLVDKVFYSETPVENKPPVETMKPVAMRSSRALLQQQSARSLTVDPTWNAFSDEIKATNSGRSSGTGAGENWAEFPSVPVVKPQLQSVPQPPSFDPFAPGSPIHASPKSVHSTPADPFVAQEKKPSWEPFQEGMTVQTPQVQTGWSQFETKPIEAATHMGRSGSMERPAESAVATPNGISKSRAPAMDPLPEEWFSLGATAAQTERPTAAFQPPDVHKYQQPVQQTSAFAGGTAFGGAYTPPGAFTQAQPYTSYTAQQAPLQTSPQPYGYSPQSARGALSPVSSFRSTAAAPQQWAQPQSYMTLQKQESMASYVSHRVDESSHNPLFQNLDMDMRAKAHSVTGVPIQPSAHTLFQSSGLGGPGFSRPVANPPFQQPFMQAPPQTGFDEATGNPFA